MTQWCGLFAILLFSNFCEFIHGYRIDSGSPSSDLFDDSGSWKLKEKPNLNDTTSNFIFETANSFLQHWPNTRYRNGHTIVPVTIPTGTLLYHGSDFPDIPDFPEWLSMDPEHSYMFCGVSPLFPPANLSAPEKGCWLMTFVTTRPLKLLYFDGSSGAKITGGPMDSQDLITWGEIREDWLRKERERIDILCKWGQDYDLDGFLRMEMDFEIMGCNFRAGMDAVTIVNLTNVLPIPRLPGLPSPAMVPMRIRVLEAGSWSNHFPGDERIKVDYSRLISFYDKTLFPNLHLQRAAQERWDHRLKGINDVELDRLGVRLDQVLRKQEQESESLIDWKTLLHVMTNRYADRLEMLDYLLKNATTSWEDLWKANRFVSAILTPYILHNSVPPDNSLRNDHEWAAPVFKICATTHTQYLENSLFANFTSSERLLLHAVLEVSKEICRALVVMWAEGKELLTEPHRPELAVQHPDNEDYGGDEKTRRNILVRWRTSISDLMAWLGWSVWVRCRPECSFEEMCYLPTYPYFFHRGRSTFSEDPQAVSADEGIWDRPQPMCLRRLEPYDL